MSIEEEDAPEFIPPFDDEPISDGGNNEVSVLLGLATLSIFIANGFGAFVNVRRKSEGVAYALGYISVSTLIFPLGLVIVLLIFPKFRNPRSCVRIFMWASLFCLLTHCGASPAAN